MSSIQLGFNPANCGAQAYNYAPPANNVLFAAPGGVSTNPGTEASPLNLAAAFAQITAGGTVVCKGGTYRNVGAFNHGGKPFSVVACRNEVPIFDGSTVITSAWTVEGALWKTPFTFTHAAPTFQNAEQHYTATTQFLKNFHQIFVDGVPLYQVGTKAAVTADKFWIDTAAGQLYIGTNPSGKELAYSSRMHFLVSGGGNTATATPPELKGLTIRNYAEAALKLGYHNTLLENCRIENCGKYAVQAQGTNITLRKGLVSHIGMLAMTAGNCTGVKFEDLQIFNSGVYPYNANWHMGAIKIVGNFGTTVWNADFKSRTFGVNFVVSNCDIRRDARYGNYMLNGVWLDEQAANSRVVNCRIQNFLNGVLVECCQRNAFYGNQFPDCNIGINVYHSQDTLIMNNTFENAAFGIQVADTGRREPTQSTHDVPAMKPHYITRNAKIYNNLLIGSRYGEDTSRAINVRVYGTDDPNLYVTEAKNNVIVRRNKLVAGVQKATPVNVWSHKNGATVQALFPTLASLRQVYPPLEANSFVIGVNETVTDASYVPTNTKIVNAGFPLNAEQAEWFALPSGTVSDIGAMQSVQTTAPPPPTDPEPPPPTDPCALQNQEIANLTAVRDEQVGQISLLNSEIQLLNATIAALEAGIVTKDTEIASLNATIATKDTQISSLQSQLTTSQNLAASRLTSLNEANALVATRDTEIQNLQNSVASKDTQIATLSASIASKDTQIATLSTSLNNSTQTINTQTVQIQNLTNEKNAVTVQLTTAQAELQGLLDWTDLTTVITTLLNEKGISVNSLQVTIN